MQFDYNSDFASLSPVSPPEFPAAEPHPCARMTTRIYHPSNDTITTVQDVLVRTMLPKSRGGASGGASGVSGGNKKDYIMSYSSSSSSSSSEESFMTDDEDDATNAAAATVDDADDSTTPQRAYWMQRSIREAIYGRVMFAIVLKKQRVREAEWVVTTERCAIKEMSWQHIRKERDRLAEDPIKEVNAMQYLKQWYEVTATEDEESSLEAMSATNIMMPMDLLTDDRHLYSVMPFCDGGELFDKLDTDEKFTENEARYWMQQILNGLEGLQRAGICHRDMSLENLLVHKNTICLVIDLGMCLRVPRSSESMAAGADTISASMTNMSIANNGVPMAAATTTTPAIGNPVAAGPRHLLTPQGTCGKWIYMSPEIYRNTIFDGFAVDVWAAGVILFLMLTGFPPWERACGTDERFKYMSSGYLVQMLTEWELGLTSDAMDLLQRMMWSDPKDRLSLEQVRAHPWMQGPGTPPPPPGFH